MLGEPRWYRSPSVVFAGAALAVVVVAELIFARGSGTPSSFSLFLGHFHPLVVHLPIGVLVLVGLAELATFSPRFRERVDPALGLALPVLVLVTLTAFVLGHFLGRSGGFPAHALTLHRRFEFVATAGVCISLALYARQSVTQTPAARTVYRGALFATLTLLSVGAHFGGSVTHGDSYLTEYAPGPLKALLGGADAAKPASSASARKPKSSEPLVFDDVVRPILGKYCVDCHGPKKQKGKLRLDSLEAVLKGGEDGPAAVAGSSATSELVKRVKLPPDDDDRMPPEGKPGPTPEELAVISFWIDRGALPTLRVRDTLAPVSGRKLLEAALAKAPNVPGAVTSAVPQADAKEPDGPGEDPAEKAPHPKADADPERNEKRSTKDAAPAVEETSAQKTSQPALAKSEPPAASAPSGPAVLAERCEKCHGASKKKAGLRVDSLEALLAGGENGPAVVPGDPGASEIVRRVRLSLATKGHMPPKKEPQPSAAEISALAAWVRGLSKRAESSSAKKPAEAVAKAEASSPAASPESTSASEPASGAEDSAPNSETTAASSAGRSADAASSGDSSNDDAPADAELLARVPERIVLYEQAVRPLLATRCGKCHSGAKPAARLRVDDYAALVEGGLSGPGVVPGRPDESLVVQRIGLPASDDDHMPPEGERPLTADEVALVRFWVTRGAARELALASKDIPASPLRAAAEYVPKGGETPALHADAGCAACAVGRSNGSANALALAALACGLFVARRRTRGVSSQNPARTSK
jgi:mono/diheme cytochrome c family protein